MPEPKPANTSVIKLTDQELRWTVSVGCERNLSAKAGGFKDSAGYKGLGFDAHIMGAGGELAVCRFMGVLWRGSIDDFKALPDIAPHHEVRTRSEMSYDLIVRPNDPVKRIYWLVTATDCRTFLMRGWLPIENYGRLATYEAAPGGRPSALFIPTKALNDPNNSGWRTYKFGG